MEESRRTPNRRKKKNPKQKKEKELKWKNEEEPQMEIQTIIKAGL